MSSETIPMDPLLIAAAQAKAKEIIEEERMSRTMEVKVRLGPIMDRMKRSLQKIQELEESLNRSKHLVTEDSDASTRGRTLARVSRKDHKGKDDDSHTTNSTMMIHSRSRNLLKISMNMIKKKLSALQDMESQLRESEDRRQDLQHRFLQVSLDRPSRELANTRQHKQQLESHVARLEQEQKRMAKKCSAADELQRKVAVLREQLREMHKVQQELESSNAERDLLIHDLAQRQTKIQEQSVRLDDLECQCEQLTAMCDNIMKSLAVQEKLNSKLERELNEERQGKMHSQALKMQSSEASTAPESDDSCTLSSSSQDESVEEEDHMPMRHRAENDSATTFRLQNFDASVMKAESPTKTVGTSVCSFSSHSVTDIELPGDTDTSRISIFEDEECSAAYTDAPEKFMIEKLVGKIEIVDRENADLVQSQNAMISRLHALLHENEQQAATILQLQCQLKEEQRKNSKSVEKLEPATGATVERKGYSASFFKKLLHADA